VKLERLHRRARALGCARLATGHYARRRLDAEGRPHLFAGVDAKKDQSYFLFGTAPPILRDLLLPLGAWTKAQVRDVALERGLPVAHKLESQEVCFVGGAGAGGFVMRQPEAQGDHRGRIVDTAGRDLGEHPGVMHYTVGQRRGLGVSAPHPLRVLQLDAETKTVTVGRAEELEKTGLRAGRASWPSGRPAAPVRARVKIRYRDPGTEAWVEATDEGGARVRFERPVRAVAPGQAAVFYAGEEVLGGAWIEEGLD
jgi:tRNA-specific 2-thiouridylase